METPSEQKPIAPGDLLEILKREMKPPPSPVTPESQELRKRVRELLGRAQANADESSRRQQQKEHNALPQAKKDRKKRKWGL
jgi:hypothetical protein